MVVDDLCEQQIIVGMKGPSTLEKYILSNILPCHK